MREEKTISSIMIQKVESERLVIKIPVASLPSSLRSGEVIAEAIKVLCGKVETERLAEKLERFLERAYKAEGKKNYFRAARAYALALYCEGMLQTDVDNGCAYVRQAMPVY